MIPGALHAALTVLEQWGTMSFEQVAARAIEYAGEGFPLRPRTAAAITRNLKFFESWPENQRYWLKPDHSMYKPGETIKLPSLARTLTRMVEAERAHKSDGRRYIGESDELGYFPKSRPVTPAEVAATLYRGLGLDPHQDLPGPQNRPLPLADYSVQAIKELF